jgi:hypothetical protein
MDVNQKLGKAAQQLIDYVSHLRDEDPTIPVESVKDIRSFAAHRPQDTQLHALIKAQDDAMSLLLNEFTHNQGLKNDD